MFEELAKFDFENHSDADIFILAKQTFPDFQEFLPLYQQFTKVIHNLSEKPAFECKTCEVRQKCTQHNSKRDIERQELDCLLYKNFIPNRNSGKNSKLQYHNDMSIFSKPGSSGKQALSGSKEFQEKIMEDRFAPYEQNKTIFNRKQWEAIKYRKEGLTQEEIGKKLGISRTAVSGRLIRADKKLDDHYRKMRDELL